MKKTTIDNPRYPHTVTIKRVVPNDNPFSTEEAEVTTLYYGDGRAFTDTTTTGDADMDLNHRKCSIPVRFDEWSEEILDGDTIIVKVGEIEYGGIVKDIEPDNNRTLIYWNRPRV